MKVNLRVQITDDRGEQHRAELEIPNAALQELRLLAAIYNKPLAEVFAVASSSGLDVMLSEYAKLMLKQQKADMDRLMGSVQCGLA